MRRYSVSIVLLAFLSSFSLLFQNCGVAPTSQSGSTSSSGDSTGLSGGGTTPPPVGAETADQIAARECGAILGTPILENISIALFDFNNGMGAKAGDLGDANFTVKAKKNVTNVSRETQYDCARRTVTNIIVQMNPSNFPSSFSQAFDNNGVNLVSTMEAKDLPGLAGRAVQFTSGEANRETLTGSVRVRVNRGNNSLRCVQGTVYASVIVQQTIQGNMDVEKRSLPQTVRVNLNNSCYHEARLKPQEGQFPFIGNAGRSVSVDGSWAAAVVPKENLGSVIGAGAVSVYRFDGASWNFHSKLQIPDASTSEELAAVVVKGNNLVVSSFLRKGRGAVFLYQFNGSQWVLQQTLDAFDTQANQYFGFSLAFNGSNLLVGAPHFSTQADFRQGAVYHYTLSGSRFDYRETILPISGGSSSQGFGMSLALGGKNGDLLLVGAPQALSYESEGPGAVHIFRFSGGSFGGGLTRVTPPTGANELNTNNGMKFGAAVAIDNEDRMVVGAPFFINGNSNRSGAVVFYPNALDTGNTTNRKVLKSGTSEANFGNALAISGGRLAIGAPYASATSQNLARAGVVYAYRISGAVLDGSNVFEIYARNATANDGFGYSVSLSGTNVMIGAMIKSDPLRDSGALYISGLR